MDKTVVVISVAESFTVRGLLIKLKGAGLDAVYSQPKIRELSKVTEDASLFIVQAEDNVGEMADALVYLKDHCLVRDKQVIVVGTKNDHRTAEQLLTENLVLAFFEKPADMAKITDTALDYLDDESARLRRKSILIVDDDISYMRLIYEWLNGTYRVAIANSGMQAITWLAKNHADLILLDYEMPVTTGPKVLEMIRSEPETANIAVMFLTGKSDRDSIMSVLSLKPSDYILKTVTKDELRNKLETFFIEKAIKNM